MSKIMLVEDDNNLREIYEARLLAEGYEIVSAHDGEEALALAVKEKPDLIISDVMMPKISGFDMLDILRSTPETRDTKVIMMTALSQAEDKERADKLGADRYLVKSQVTLEDVAKIAREVLEGTGGGAQSPVVDEAPVAATPVAADPVVVAPVAVDPVAVTPVISMPVDDPTTDSSTPLTSTLDTVEDAQSVSDEQTTVNDQVKQFVDQTPGTDMTPASAAPVAAPLVTLDDTLAAESSSGVNGKKVLQPITDPNAKPDLNKLLEEEEKKSGQSHQMITPQSDPSINPADDPNLIAL